MPWQSYAHCTPCVQAAIGTAIALRRQNHCQTVTRRNVCGREGDVLLGFANLSDARQIRLGPESREVQGGNDL